MGDVRVLETQMLFGPADHRDAAPEVVTLRYEQPMPREDAELIEDAIREGWHTGQMRVEARRLKEASAGAPDDESERDALRDELAAAHEALYARTRERDDLRKELSRLRSELELFISRHAKT